MIDRPNETQWEVGTGGDLTAPRLAALADLMRSDSESGARRVLQLSRRFAVQAGRRLGLDGPTDDDVAQDAALAVLASLEHLPAALVLVEAGRWIRAVVGRRALATLDRERRRVRLLVRAGRVAAPAGNALRERLRAVDLASPRLDPVDTAMIGSLMAGQSERQVAARHGLSRSALRRRLESILRRAPGSDVQNRSPLRMSPDWAAAVLEHHAAALSAADACVLTRRAAGASYRELATCMGTTPGAVNQRLRRISARFSRTHPNQRNRDVASDTSVATRCEAVTG